MEQEHYFIARALDSPVLVRTRVCVEHDRGRNQMLQRARTQPASQPRSTKRLSVREENITTRNKKA